MKSTQLLLFVIAVLGVTSCKEAQKSESGPRPVKVAKVESVNSIQKSFSGIVAADQFSDLAFKMSGLLQKMNVIEGQRVKKGFVIAEIDPIDYKLDYEAKKASFQKAKASFERAEKLLSRDAISVQDYEASQAAYTNAQVAYDNSANTLRDTRLIAPFDGFIQKKYVENYQRTQPGQAVVCLVNPTKLQVDFTLPESNIDYITGKNDIYVEFDSYKGKRFKATVKEFVRASVAGAGIPVSLNIIDTNFSHDQYNIAVGYSCRVFINNHEDKSTETLAVPLSAIVYDNKTDSKSVFVYNDDTHKVEQRKIEDSGVIIGKENVIVTGEISADDSIVVAGATRVVDGQTVKLLTE